MSEKFYNPYQFIPVRAPETKHLTDYTHLDSLKAPKNRFVRHDYWHKDGLSGRLMCTVTLESPTFVGGKHSHDKNQKPAPLTGYQRSINGKALYLLPANSLRGMVSSIAETLSQSSLRILENETLSVRKAMRDSLPALGRLIKISPKEGYSEYGMQPLTFSTHWECEKGYFKMPEAWQKYFKGRSLQKILPVYLDGYGAGQESHTYRRNSFLDKEKPASFPQKNDQNSLIFYYARLESALAEYKAEDEVPANSPGLYIKDDKTLIGQRLCKVDNNLLNESAYLKLAKAEQQKYTKGILRVLDVVGRKDIPHTKKHELFIPWPDDLEANGKPTNLKPIKKAVETTYVALIEEREADTKKNDANAKAPILLKGYKSAQFWTNKLFYFDINEAGNISEVSLSSIWRKAVGQVHDYFRAIDSNLLPWSESRSALTPAEALFGVVQEDKSTIQDSRNLAARVRFSDAIPMGISHAEQQLEAQAVTLKILSSPKLPAPSMYFHNAKASGFIKKIDLNAKDHEPNGRKVYLHQYQQQGYSTAAWVTKDATANIDQKVTIRPLRAGISFQLTIDFENLSQAELGLLAKSLEPDVQYVHRLGMGKPLGLGSVKIKLTELLMLNRITHYQITSFKQLRYSEAWLANPTEQSHNQASAIKKLAEYRWDSSLIHQDTLRQLVMSGNPNKLDKTIPITSPLELGQASETEGFKWFSNNADHKGQPKEQMLGAITTSIPTLKKNRR